MRVLGILLGVIPEVPAAPFVRVSGTRGTGIRKWYTLLPSNSIRIVSFPTCIFILNRMLYVYSIHHIYLLNHTYNNSGYKWIPQEVIDMLNNCEDPRTIYLYTKQIVTFFFLCFDLSIIKFLINTREKQELSGVEPGTSGLLAFGCPTEPSTPYLINTDK